MCKVTAILVLLVFVLSGCDAICAMSGSQHQAHADNSFRPTTSYPLLEIQTLKIPQDKSQPLSLFLRLTCEGKTPLALARGQFGVFVSTRENPYLLTGNLSFSKESPEIVTLSPQQTVVLDCKAPGTKFKGTWWGDLKPGVYTLRISIHSQKTRRFDYHWLGQTSSNDYQLEIK